MEKKKERPLEKRLSGEIQPWGKKGVAAGETRVPAGAKLVTDGN